MERRLTHKYGPELSRIVAGAWRWDIEVNRVERLIRKCLDVGITTFDHADIYGDHGNEEIFGNVLKTQPSLRQEMEIVTKCGIKFPSARRPDAWIKHYDTSKEHILWSVNNSLKMLRTDYIDLLLIHRPDPLLDPAAVAEAFAALKQSGKVRHFGVSNFTATQFEMLRHYLPMPLVTNQLEISVLRHEAMFDGSIDVLMKHEVAPMAWSPLGGGKLLANDQPSMFSKSEKYKATDAQLALAWLLKHPSSIFPVIGTANPDRIAESAEAANIRLEVQDWFEILKAAQGREMP